MSAGLLALACSTQPSSEPPPSAVPLPEAVFGHWIHSHEDDTADLTVYRPAGYTFPPSRGRAELEIHRDGGFVQRSIAPTDGLLEAIGSWELLDSGVVQVDFEDPTQKRRRFEIVAAVPGLLRLRE